MSVAGLMNESKFTHNVIRTGDVLTKAPYTVLNSENGTVIQLPLPTNLSSSMGMDWQQESVNIPKFQLMHNKEAINNLRSMSYKDMFGSLKNNSVEALKKGWSGMMEDKNQILARTKSRSKIGGIKVAVNPRNEMMFNGMQFKSYSFNFLLVPYEQRDSDNIQKAIRAIQKASVPELKGAKMFMVYPETWWITFMSGEENGNEYLMKINECCCTGISVNYTPNGDSSNMHKKNAPLSVELSLDFTEIFIPSKENIEDYNG
jgi:hypothetical protein